MPNAMIRLRRLISGAVPQRLKLMYYVHKKPAWRQQPLDKKIIGFLADQNKVSVDIGANIGTVAYIITKYARETHAFELNPYLAKRLEKARLPNLIVHRIGLSDEARMAKLRIPIESFGLVLGNGTIEPANALEGRDWTEMDVAVDTLDSFGLQNVGFIKIDVEGHEVFTLKGALKTLETSRPSLVVEIVESLNGQSFSAIQRMLGALSYRCVRLVGNSLVQVNAPQDRPGANDYYFLQADVLGILEEFIASAAPRSGAFLTHRRRPPLERRARLRAFDCEKPGLTIGGV